MIVDSHTHAATSWFEPIEALLFHMDRNQVDQAVLVQMFGQYDNEYQQECVRRYPDRLVSVVQVDVAGPDTITRMERLAADGASGIRMRPALRSPGDDPLAVWRTAARLGLTVSCGGGGDVYLSEDFAQVLAAVNPHPVVIEHLGGFHRDGVDLAVIRPKLATLAAHANVYLKIHGLGQFATRAMPARSGDDPFEQPVPPLLEAIVEVFGANRVMWGSEFSAVSMREGYRNALQLPMARLATLSDTDRALVFGQVASRIFRLPNR